MFYITRASTGIGPFNTNWSIKCLFVIIALLLATLNANILVFSFGLP